ncbi:23663_t:CDS:10 [Entrophospora sp. SA101]|nr:23663_t:CDS:10 [Entrophospora sp. SA101]
MASQENVVNKNILVERIKDKISEEKRLVGKIISQVKLVRKKAKTPLNIDEKQLRVHLSETIKVPRKTNYYIEPNLRKKFMKEKNKEEFVIFQEKLRKLESEYSATKEKLKMYGLDGDFSENADWVLLEEKKNKLQTKIDLLKAKMTETNQEDEKIITYRLLATGEEKTIKVTNWEIDPFQGRISFTSPLGLALINKKVGEISESEKSLIIFATGQGHSLIDFPQQQIGRDYLKEKRNKIQAIIINNTSFRNIGLLENICQELGPNIPLYTSAFSKTILTYLFPKLRNKIIIAEKNKELKLNDFTINFFPLNSYLLGNLGKKVIILNKEFATLIKRILFKHSLSEVISLEKKGKSIGIYLLVTNPEQMKEKISYQLEQFPAERKNNFHFVLGLPPVVGGEEKLAGLVDYLYTQSEEITNFSKSEYLRLGISLTDLQLICQLLQPTGIITLQNSYKNEKFLAHLPEKFLTLTNGTGQARQGSIRAPQFRGGGTVFGPRGVENYSLAINKKFKKKVFHSLLGEKMRKKEIVIIDKLVLENYKTKEAKKLLNDLPNKSQKTLIILAQKEEKKLELTRSFRNLPYITIMDSSSLNTAQILPFNSLIFTYPAFQETEKRLKIKNQAQEHWNSLSYEEKLKLVTRERPGDKNCEEMAARQEIDPLVLSRFVERDSHRKHNCPDCSLKNYPSQLPPSSNNNNLSGSLTDNAENDRGKDQKNTKNQESASSSLANFFGKNGNYTGLIASGIVLGHSVPQHGHFCSRDCHEEWNGTINRNIREKYGEEDFACKNMAAPGEKFCEYCKEEHQKEKKVELERKLEIAISQRSPKKEIEKLQLELQNLNNQPKNNSKPEKNNNGLIGGQLIYQKSKFYAFYVLPSANKFQIKQELEKMFPIKVKKVRTSRQKPVLHKARFLQKSPSKIYTKLKKKAFIELMPGSKLPEVFEEVRIAHLADIHIKDNRREEYSVVFEKLYQQLHLESPDIIAICGDIFHDKTKASAYNYSDVESFLMRLIEIASVILIPGNHDLNIKVPGAPDLISPVVIVIAPDGSQPSPKEIEETAISHNLKNSPQICLIHETIDGALLYNGTSLRDKRLAPRDLINYDAVLAGDIHLQQNIGGKLELSTEHSPYRTPFPKIRRVNIPNEQGYLKVKLQGGKDITIQPSPTSPNYYEIIYDETTTTEQLNFQIERLTEIYGIPPQATRLIKNSPDLLFDNGFSSTLGQAQIDAQSLETHEEIIRGILGEENPYVRQVIELHRSYYLNTLSQGRTRARVRLLQLQFSNLYCYGPDNLIDFTHLNSSLSGAIAPNRAGKSTLIDIIVFALYDKYPRAEKKIDIVNAKSTEYYLRLDFELDGKFGYIEKQGKKNKKKHDAHCKLVYDNQELTQGTNTLTCQEIEKLVGIYSNAELTAILHQDSRTDFVQLKSSERKQALARLLALGSFEKLEKEMREESREMNGKVSALEEGFQGKEAAEIIKEKQNFINSGNEAKNQLQGLDNKLEVKKKDLRNFVEQKEKLSINLARIQDKITNLGPECSISLGEAETELEKILKIITVDAQLSPTEEYATYLFHSTDNNFTANIDLELIAIPTRDQVLEIIQQVRLVQKNKKEQESKILAEINRLETDKARITAFLETSFKYLQENHTKLLIDIKELKVEKPTVKRPEEKEMPWSTYQEGPRPSLEEVIKGKNELTSFQNEKTSARTIILQNLAVVSNNLVPPVQDEKVGEYDTLLASSAKDRELISNKSSLEAEFQSAKLKLETARLAESKHNTLTIQQKVEDVKVKLLAAENAQQIRRQLKLQENCSGCEYTKSLFAEDKITPLQQDLENILLEAASSTIYNTYLAEKEMLKLESNLQQVELAQTRIERLTEIQDQREKFIDYQKELSLISQKLAESQSSLTELVRLETESLKTENQYINLRKLGLEKVISAVKNVEDVKEAAKNRAERHKLQIESQLTKKKIADYKEKIISLESELTDLGSQRDKTMGQIASAEAEVKRLNKSLVEETKRKDLLTETQEKINIITAYRKILDPKTGIADYLLKRSRAYLEEAVNSVLGECSTNFRVYINEEFELSTSVNNQSEQGSEVFLSATLGSGYQKFVLSLAFRKALWKLAEVPLPDCQFIDEGFGCCDEDNLEAIAQYLVVSTSALDSPSLIFIVSHIETLKNAIQKPLIIKVGSLGSEVRNDS